MKYSLTEFFQKICRRITYEFDKRNPFKEDDWYKKWIVYGYPRYKSAQKRTIKRIKYNGHANVVFFAVNEPMWRYQGIYDKMLKDKRFSVSIVVCSLSIFTDSQKENNFQQISCYFRKKGIRFIDGVHCKDSKSIIKSLNPDILFYTQPYDGVMASYFDIRFNKGRLLCYTPYSLLTVNGNFAYNSDLQNVGWKLFYATTLHKKRAREISYRRDENVVVVGEPNADYYKKTNHPNPWKECGQKKRIVYAPHFAIIAEGWLHRDGFLWTGELIQQIAERESEKIQVAFKPHPRLKTELYNHPEWGKEKTDKYYEKWISMENGQIEEGGFIDLFVHSDAIIHDSGSFTGEYLYVNKPCMFLARDSKLVTQELDEFGLKCFNLHYLGQSAEDVERFVTDIVIANKDQKRDERTSFYNDFLVPPNGKSVAENMYNEIVNSLFF